MPSTMQAIQAADYGGPEVLKIGEAHKAHALSQISHGRGRIILHIED